MKDTDTTVARPTTTGLEADSVDNHQATAVFGWTHVEPIHPDIATLPPLAAYQEGFREGVAHAQRLQEKKREGRIG